MKPKIIQSSKDMLSRSFNPVKCKTSLKLAASRLKLLRNKKEVQVKQMKKEIALLLESGQDRTARIRVEHVVREEKMMDAFELLNIYCELIVARMPIIESQRTCPVDMKEAIASVLFATPRCGDVTELMDVKKHLTAKYGKDFTTAAVELRPQCGVGRLLVEKLSAASPDGQTKIKILTKIAQEHNIAWTPMSLDEKDLVPHMDIQSGPSTPGVGSLDAEVKGNVNMRSFHSNSPEYIAGPSVGAERTVLTSSSSVTTSSESRARPSEDRAQSFQGDSNDNFKDGEKFNLKFKDAASAAREAFESAERASAAARVALELSSRERMTGAGHARYDDFHIPDHDGRLGNENISSYVNEGPSSKKIDSIEHIDLRKEEIYKNAASGVPETSVHSLWKHGTTTADDFLDQRASLKKDQSIYSQEAPETVKSALKHSDEALVSTPDEKDDFHAVDNRNLRSSYSQSDAGNIFAVYENQKIEIDADRYPFDHGGIHEEASTTPSNDLDGIFFDKVYSYRDYSSGSGPIYDVGDDLAQNTAPFLFHEFSGSLMSKTSSGVDGVGYGKFDDSDGFSSEGDQNAKSDHFEAVDKLYEQNEVEHSVNDAKHMQPSYDEWNSEDSKSKSIDFDDDYSPGGESRLSFGELTGGFRNKHKLDANKFDVPSSGEKKDESNIKATLSDNAPVVLPPMMSLLDKRNTGTSDVNYENDGSVEESLQKVSRQENYYASIRKGTQNRSTTGRNVEGVVSRRTKPSSTFGTNSPTKFDLQERSIPSDLGNLIQRDTLDVTSRSKGSPKNETEDTHAWSRGESPVLHEQENSLSNRTGYQFTIPESEFSTSKVLPSTQVRKSRTASSSKQDAKFSQKSPASGKSSNPEQKPVQSTAIEIPKKPTISEESNKRMSHVHPKLPDYDTLVESLRKRSS